MMDEPRIPLYRSEPERFRRALFTEDPNERFEMLGGFGDFAICEFVRVGLVGGSDSLLDAQTFYQRYFRQADRDQRWTIFREVSGIVENTQVEATSLIPFIEFDSDPAIVSTAVIDAVSLATPPQGDEMYIPGVINRRIEDDEIANRGAAFGGLLHLGDPEICRLIWPTRNLLDQSNVNVAVRCATGVTAKCVMEFYLAWLEGMDADASDGLFGSVASGLALLKIKALSPQIMTGRRPIPSKGLSAEAKREIAQFRPEEQVLRELSPRFYALDRTEPEPKVMPEVLQIWGL